MTSEIHPAALGRRLVRWAAAVLPTGHALPVESWRVRHTWITTLLWAHVPGIAAFSVATGAGLSHAVIEAAVVVPFAVGASTRRLGRSARSVLATIGLTTCSAVLTHLSGGLIEMHFHYFVVVALVTLYQSWLPFAVAIGYVLLHHGVMGAIAPASVFNHPAALAHPWRWATIHAVFIGAESIVALVAWRLNERALEGERAARRALQGANRDLSAAQSLAHLGSWEWELDTEDISWSEELYRIVGVDRSFVPSVEGFRELVHPDDRHRLDAAVSEALADGNAFELEHRIVRPDGAVRTVRAAGSAPEEPAGTRRLVGTLQDVTDQRVLEEEIRYKAFHDPLTGLANRALLLERLNHALTRRSGSTPVALLFLDLDHFKVINDELGHAVGDELLIRFAGHLEHLTRPEDTVARFGGDEFAILLEDADTATAITVAERIVSSTQTPFALSVGDVNARTSIGIAVAEERTTSDALFRDADIAMYAAKAEGKNRARVCTPEMRTSVHEDLLLRRELEAAIEAERFVLHYQPILTLDDRELESVEALVRWDHPERGIVPPAAFIPVAEATGSIVRLGAWVLREATRYTKDLQATLGRRVAVSVNVSARQLESPDIVEVVDDALRGSELDPDDLILEITETAMLANERACIPTLLELRRLGVRIAIDDFGTGYSSLSYLHSFPVDIMKIDRSFVAAVADGHHEAAFAETIVQLAGMLHLRTTAEGIETIEQLERLRELGCETGQGYLFSRPLDGAALLEWALGSGAPTFVVDDALVG